MFYRNIFFVKQKTIFFPTFMEMHISHIFVNNLNTLPQEHMYDISFLLNVLCLDVSVGFYYLNLMSFTVLQCFL